MMFLPKSLTAAATRHVHNSPADQLPRFRKGFTGEVHVRGAILRYSTATPANPKGQPNV
jgi:hypothetical protein